MYRANTALWGMSDPPLVGKLASGQERPRSLRDKLPRTTVPVGETPAEDGARLDRDELTGASSQASAWSSTAGGRLLEDITHAEAFVRLVGPWLVHVIEAISVLFILAGVARAAVGSLVSVLRDPDRMPSTRVRLDLGRSLSFALEFLLAADILQTMLSPTMEQVAILGGVAVIRTLLNYFLGKEIEQENRELREAAAARAAAAAPVAATGSVRAGD